VSVVAGCYNHARFLPAFLQSVYEQEFDSWELIVVDDGSQDGSVAVARRWLDQNGDSRTRLVPVPHGGRVSRTFNIGLSLARGEHVAFVSTDDILMPQRLARQSSLLGSLRPRVGLVYSDMYLIDVDGVQLAGTYLERIGCIPELAVDGPSRFVHSKLLRGNAIPAPAVMTSREMLDLVGPFDEDLIFEDWDMWLRIANLTEVHFSPYVSMSYRLVPGSLSDRIDRVSGDGLADEFPASCLQILEKWRDRVSPSDQRFIVEEQGELAWVVYKASRSRGSLPFLYRATRQEPTARNISRLLFAGIGLNPVVAARFGIGSAQRDAEPSTGGAFRG
jgi:glycosyltransferase involved in cell wall biosynthesis